MTGVQTCALPICFPVTIGGPNRYMVEAYEIGGRMPVLTGRGGMNNLLKGGYIPLKVYLNGQPMEVDDFIKQFKQLTHE